MRLNTNARYAIRVLFELASTSLPVSSAILAEKTGLSMRAVENIQFILKQNGITSGTVGAKGGVTLEVPLTQISLGDIIRIFDEGVEFAVCCGDKANDCPNQNTCDTRAVWRTVSSQIQQELDKICLHDIFQQLPAANSGTLAAQILDI